MAVENGETNSYEDWLASIKGEKGNTGDNIELRVSGGYIQWKATSDTTWQNLLSLNSLKGDKGEKGDDGKNGETPYIGQNGHWFIGDVDTGISATEEILDLDYNEDGYVDCADINILMQYLVGRDVDVKYGDINGDGTVDNKDVTRFLQYAAGWNVNFPKGIEYTYSVKFDYNTTIEAEELFDKTPEYMHLVVNHTIRNLELPKVKENNNAYILKGWYIKGTDTLITENIYLPGDTELEARWEQISN